MKIFTLLLALVVFSVYSQEKPVTTPTIETTPLSVPCYGNQINKCKSGEEFLTHMEYLNSISSEPVVLVKIHYFSDRDDKIILEYETAEQHYTRTFVFSLMSELNQRTVFPFFDIHAFLHSKLQEANENCPVKDGCEKLIASINSVIKSI